MCLSNTHTRSHGCFAEMVRCNVNCWVNGRQFASVFSSLSVYPLKLLSALLRQLLTGLSPQSLAHFPAFFPLYLPSLSLSFHFVSPLQSIVPSFCSCIPPPFLSYLLLSTVARIHPYKSFNPVAGPENLIFFLPLSCQAKKSVNRYDNPACFQCNSFCIKNLTARESHTQIRDDVTRSAFLLCFMMRFLWWLLWQRHSRYESEAARETTGVVFQHTFFLKRKNAKKGLFIPCPRFPCLVCLRVCRLECSSRDLCCSVPALASLCQNGAFHHKLSTPCWLFFPPIFSVLTLHQKRQWWAVVRI